MNQDYSTALLLLAVGMIAVFSILALIVLLGSWLIKFVNRYFPETTKDSAPPKSSNSKSFDPIKLAVIVSAVDIVTKGKGKVVSAKKDER